METGIDSVQIERFTQIWISSGVEASRVGGVKRNLLPIGSENSNWNGIFREREEKKKRQKYNENVDVLESFNND